MISSILANDTTDPIIVIHSDHGSAPISWEDVEDPTVLKARMRNFVAIRFPDADAAAGLYPTITPVNIWRVTANAYLGTSYPLLPDTSYFSNSTLRYDLRDVTETVNWD